MKPVILVTRDNRPAGTKMIEATRRGKIVYERRPPGALGKEKARRGDGIPLPSPSTGDTLPNKLGREDRQHEEAPTALARREGRSGESRPC